MIISGTKITRIKLARVTLVLLFTSLCSPVMAAANQQTNSNPVPGTSATWLETLNYYRIASGVSPVKELKAFSEAAKKHAIYVGKTPEKYFTGVYANKHKENPDSPYATEAGITDGAGQIAWSSSDSAANSVHQLMAAPIHTIGFLRENLETTGYGFSPEDGKDSFVHTFSTLSGLSKEKRSKVILFPGDGSTVKLNSFDGNEVPEPRESCAGDWKSFSGLAIIASLLKEPHKNLKASLTTPDEVTFDDPENFCVVTENNFKTTDESYGGALGPILSNDHMVVMFARNPLSYGLHTAKITQPGQKDITWSFNVLTPPLATHSTVSKNGKSIEWKNIRSISEDPVLGYTIKVKDQVTKKVDQFTTTEDYKSYASFNLGNDLQSKLFCVSVETRLFSIAEPSCFYGPGIETQQTLKASYPWVGDFAYLEDKITLYSNYKVDHTFTLSTPSACTAKMNKIGQVEVIGKTAKDCIVTISNEGLFGVAAATKKFTLKFIDKSKSNTVISCFKAGVEKRFIGYKPTCPSGYKTK
ncbi:MAG: hypothetical protein EXQ80_04275 [Candidatus Nanopelagicaceae bacterium]|nr:hypothetical protein [Candidatus Nanopelagicaceae bacterium]